MNVKDINSLMKKLQSKGYSSSGLVVGEAIFVVEVKRSSRNWSDWLMDVEDALASILPNGVDFTVEQDTVDEKKGNYSAFVILTSSAGVASASKSFKASMPHDQMLYRIYNQLKKWQNKVYFGEHYTRYGHTLSDFPNGVGNTYDIDKMSEEELESAISNFQDFYDIVWDMTLVDVPKFRENYYPDYLNDIIHFRIVANTVYEILEDAYDFDNYKFKNIRRVKEALKLARESYSVEFLGAVNDALAILEKKFPYGRMP